MVVPVNVYDDQQFSAQGCQSGIGVGMHGVWALGTRLHIDPDELTPLCKLLNNVVGLHS